MEVYLHSGATAQLYQFLSLGSWRQDEVRGIFASYRFRGPPIVRKRVSPIAMAGCGWSVGGREVTESPCGWKVRIDRGMRAENTIHGARV